MCCCTSPIFVRNLVPEIYPKKVSTNQIPGFLNQPFPKNKLMKQCSLLHVDTNSQKLKFDKIFFAWAWSKIGVAKLVSGF